MDYELFKIILDDYGCSFIDNFKIELICKDGCHRELELTTIYNPKLDYIEEGSK